MLISYLTTSELGTIVFSILQIRKQKLIESKSDPLSSIQNQDLNLDFLTLEWILDFLTQEPVYDNGPNTQRSPSLVTINLWHKKRKIVFFPKTWWNYEGITQTMYLSSIIKQKKN